MERAASFSVNSFLECCGSTSFATQMAKSLPFSSLEHAINTASFIWWNQVSIPGWLEAFAAHPRIGDFESLKKKWAAGEQSAALNSATDDQLQELAEWNLMYEVKFGFIFLICASGKSCVDILKTLKARYSNQPIDEIRVAAVEQQKITELRLAKLEAWPSKFNGSSASIPPPGSQGTRDLASKEQVSIGDGAEDAHTPESTKSPLPGGSIPLPPITTHVLDVSLGRPGVGINVMLEQCGTSRSGVLDSSRDDGLWSTIGSSVTNSDGRAGPLMDICVLQAGRYRLTFKTEEYFLRTRGNSKGSGGFYPHVSIVFEVKPSQVLEHFHVPLLLSPYSYTTYRGS